MMPYVHVTFIIGAFFLAAFFVVETHYAPSLLIPFAALSSGVSFLLGAIAYGWACFGIRFFYKNFLLVLQAEPPLLATAMFVPVAVLGVCASLFVGFMLHRLGPPLVVACARTAFTDDHGGSPFPPEGGRALINVDTMTVIGSQ